MKSLLKMKLFRVVAVMVCGAGLATSAALAQQDAPPPPPDGQQQQGPPAGGRHGWDPDHRAEMMQKRLGLSDDQTAQVKAILVDSQIKMEALRSNTSLAPQDRRAQAEAMRQDQQAKVRAVLTPDQQAKFDQMQAMHHERQGGPGGDNAPPPAQPQQ